MSCTTLFISGSIHQGHEQFRGEDKCSFYEFFSPVSYLYSQQWNTCTVDQILTRGDTMYLSTALQKQTIPDIETMSLNYLPDRARSSWTIVATTQSPIDPNKSNQKSNQSPIDDIDIDFTNQQTPNQRANGQNFLICHEM